MRCKYFKKRSKKYQYYFYCTKLKKEVIYAECKVCEFKEYKDYKPIKSRTSKQAKAEKERYSIFTDNLERCIECGKTKRELPIDKHEIFRGRNRHNSMKHGLVIPLCRKCHETPEIEFKWQIKGQKEFEKKHSREEFMKIFRKSYL